MRMVFMKNQTQRYFRGLYKGVIFGAAYLGLATVSLAEAWNLPQQISDTNTKIKFEVDSTWHMVHGTVSGLGGKVWLANPQDASSIQAEVTIPVAQFDTANSSRDSRLREVMAAEAFSEVKLHLQAAPEICKPQDLNASGACQGILLGTLEIRGMKRELRLPYQMTKVDSHYIVSGKFTFEWGAFGVEDPSILIARVKPEVAVTYEVKL